MEEEEPTENEEEKYEIVEVPYVIGGDGDDGGGEEDGEEPGDDTHLHKYNHQTSSGIHYYQNIPSSNSITKPPLEYIHLETSTQFIQSQNLLRNRSILKPPLK